MTTSDQQPQMTRLLHGYTPPHVMVIGIIG